MPNVPPVHDLLQKLSSRLADIRGQRISIFEYPAFDYTSVLIPFEQNILVLLSKEAILGLSKMIDEIDSIFAIDIVDFTLNSKENKNEFLFGDGEIKTTYNNIITELKYYQEALERLNIKARQIAEMENEGNGLAPVIKLPDNFNAQHLVKNGFNPKFAIDEIALLLRYLRDKNYLPNFSKDDLGEIAILFGRSKQTVRTAYRPLDERDNEAYTTSRNSLKRHLNSIIEEIEHELLPVPRI